MAEPADVQAPWTRPGVLARIDAALAEHPQNLNLKSLLRWEVGRVRVYITRNVALELIVACRAALSIVRRAGRTGAHARSAAAVAPLKAGSSGNLLPRRHQSSMPAPSLCFILIVPLLLWTCFQLAVTLTGPSLRSAVNVCSRTEAACSREA
jgi:hypothetical protein